MGSPARRKLLSTTVALATTAVMSGAFLLGANTANAVSSDPLAVAPYVDMTNGQATMLDSAIDQGGLKSFTAAFVIGSACTPIWGDTLPVSDDPTVTGEISRAASAGGQMIVSFGGASGIELAQSCTDVASLTSAYQSVINQFGVSHIDFDVEGAAIADTASVDRRYQAIAKLEAANPNLVVSVTVPVLPSGLDYYGQAFVKAAAANGARIDVVNVMAMDYGGSWDNGTSLGAYAIQAAENTLSQIQQTWPADTYANIGITPMVGQNDDPAEKFTTSDANDVVSFAQANGVGRLAFWSVDRDQPCSSTASGLSQCTMIDSQPLDFTRIFAQYSGGGGGSSSLPAPTGLSAPGATNSSVSLTWNAVSGATSYNVYRNGNKVGSTGSTSYTDAGLAPGTSYPYTVAAVDSTGLVGAQSASTTGTTTSNGGGSCTTPWSPTTSYVPGNTASYNNHNWKATYYSTGAVPSDPGSWAVWQDNGTC